MPRREIDVARGVAIVTYTATPFFVAGLLGLHPSLWFDITVGVIVACHCVICSISACRS